VQLGVTDDARQILQHKVCHAPVKGSAWVTAPGSVRSSVAMRSPAARMEPSGRRHLSVPAAGASIGMNIFMTCDSNDAN